MFVRFVQLLGMFSGYGQTNATIWDVVLAVEKFMEDHEHRDRALDHLEEWDAGGTCVLLVVSLLVADVLIILLSNFICQTFIDLLVRFSVQDFPWL